MLLVDDDDVDREVMARLLGKFGEPMNLSVAGSLAEARVLLAQRRFDCVLLDYHLRNELGLELIPDIERNRAELCPIILVTTREGESLIVEAMRQGITDYLAKSNLNVERLRAIVSGAIDRSRAEQSRREAHAALQAMADRARREHEQALRAAADEAERTARAKSMFVANISHEIRTPLNAVIGLTYLLRRTALTSEQVRLVERVGTASKSLLLIINNVLDLSKLGAAALRLEHVAFSTRRALNELIDVASVSAESKGVALAIDVAADVPAALTGDQTRLQQVLGNLLTNAIKFTHAGEVRLSARLIGAQGGKVVVRFEVRDTGIGIPKATLPHLFQPFAQADVSTTRRYGGTGLGLSIARELVQLMGGEIGAESRVDEGSLFWIEAPFETAEETPEAPAARIDGEARLAGIKVLLVDDSDVNLEVGKAILETEGAKVATACDGLAAVQRVLAEPTAFDIVLMDLQMPVLDGDGAFRRIVAGLGGARPLVIALTAGGYLDSEREGLAFGMDGLVQKPFEVDSFVEYLRGQVGRSAGSTKRAGSAPDWPILPGIDPGLARARTGGDKALFLKALAIFVRQYSQWEPTGKTPAEIRRLMHRLKGSAAAIGAAALSELARQAETASLDEDLSRLDASVESVTAAISALRAAYGVETATAA